MGRVVSSRLGSLVGNCPPEREGVLQEQKIEEYCRSRWYTVEPEWGASAIVRSNNSLRVSGRVADIEIGDFKSYERVS